jgi:hypothetical protein
MKELIAYYHRDDVWYPFGTGSSDPNPPPVETRDPFKWPYPPDSFWNMPIGEDAVLVPLGFDYGGDNASAAGRIAIAEENVLALDPDAPLAYIKATNAGWNASLTRCGSRTGGNLVGNGSVSPMPQLPIPPGFTTETGPPYIGTTPNMSGALVRRVGSDVQLFETQPLHFCTDGVAVSQFVNSDWVGDSVYYGGYGPPIPGGGSQTATGGSHGGSYMTAFGGTIRLGEIVPDGEIKHALKVTMDTGWYTSNVRTGRVTEGSDPNTPTSTSGPLANKGGYIWPALQADSGWATSYGNLNPSVPNEAKMGMLMTVNNTFNPDSLVTEPARIMARAARNYGIYLVDGDYNAVVPWQTQWQIERSNEGAFVTEFKNTWGFEFFHKPAQHGTPSATQMQFRADLGTLMEAMCIVRDNSPTNVGGAGARRAPLAPPLEIPA